MYVADPSVGYVLKPGFAGIIERCEFRAPFTVNEDGLCGPMPRPRTENTFRILVLGGSMAFGFGVLDDEIFSVQLENMLAGRFPNLDVQVLIPLYDGTKLRPGRPLCTTKIEQSGWRCGGRWEGSLDRRHAVSQRPAR